MRRIGILGGGAWGTALATVVAGRHETLLWAREPEVVAAVNERHVNPLYLPDVPLDPAIRATGDLAEAAGVDLLLATVPTQFLRQVLTEMAPHLAPSVPVVLCCKGIEKASFRLPGEIAGEALPGVRLAVLSGPTFAIEVARGLPTAVTLACADAALGERIQQAIGRTAFRPYLADDLLGVQIGGALKNVMAIACGIVEGRRLGENARAAVLTRGLAEIVRYGRARGARVETLMGLSGLGDLSLTCNSDLSRNMSLGIQLGEGRDLAAILAERRSVAEGMYTATAAVEHCLHLDIEMPIATAVDGIVNHWANISASIDGLLGRPFRTEAA